MSCFTEDVVVLRRVETGTDRMGEPVWEWVGERVGDVLVRPLSPKPETGSDVASGLRPDGVDVKYSLAFPTGFAGSLAHARVALVERGMDPEDADSALRVSGDPDFTRVPDGFAWDRIVEVGVFRG